MSIFQLYFKYLTLYLKAFVFCVPSRYVPVLDDIARGSRIHHCDHGSIAELKLKPRMHLSAYEALERLLQGPHGPNIRALLTTLRSYTDEPTNH